MANPTPDQVATKFVSILRAWATPYQWKVMRKRNAAETDPGVCHSHDWCDANMAMAEAFEHFGLDPLPEDERASTTATNLWNEAWDAAMPALGGKTKAQFAKEGIA
jgi:hypothetical protein